ncbi:MAG: glycosyltransferase family 4 protein [Desulfobacterales bacterium]|nr:glycosyltransferase family 4 protein [Desulfobacterales bacterium]
MRILHLLSQRPDATGSGIYVQAMLREARARGHGNFLVAGINAGDRGVSENVDDDACSFVEFNGADLPFPIAGMSDVMPYPNRRFRDLTPAELIRYQRCFELRIQNAVARFRPDILHSHHLWLMTAFVRRLFPDLPLVTSCHGTDLRQFETCPHLQAWVRPAIQHLDAVLALSRIQREEILSMHGLPPERVLVTGAGYCRDLFNLPDHKPVPPPVQLIYAGKLCRAKGLPNLLRALHTIKDYSWHLTLAGGGSGPEKEECLQLAFTLGDRVTVIGAVSQPELAFAMQKAHVFILSSFFEGLPLALLEAMACGCRVIATEVPGVQELFQTDFSPWVTTLPTPPLRQVDRPIPGTEEAFENRLSELLQFQIQAVLNEPAIPANEINRFLEPFTWPRVFDRIERIYQSLT